MISFSPLRTRRICVRLRELKLGEGIALCKLPDDRPELTNSEFLRYVADAATAPNAQYVTDPRLWTVQERARVICHYISHTSEGGMDFPVGGSSLSAYLRLDEDLHTQSVDLGIVAGHARVMRPLLGVHVELLERQCESRGEWLIGMLACQIGMAGEPEVSLVDMSELDAMEWLSSRMAAIREMHESDVEEMIAAHGGGAGMLDHFFTLDFDAKGVMWLPHGKEGTGAESPARFPANSAISEVTRGLFGRADL